jgi:hypothetical protein
MSPARQYTLPDPFIAELIHLAEAAGVVPRVPRVRRRYRLQERSPEHVRKARAALRRRGYGWAT